jgi:large subunit ribosomal protein LP0
MSRSYSDKKIKYSAHLESLLTSNSYVLVADANNVGSKQLQDIRASLRGKATVLMGKNTQIRRVMRLVASQGYPDLYKLVTLVKQNVGLIFTNESIKEIRDQVEAFKVPAAAKAGTFAPTDVFVPPGPTGLDPGQTAFFQSLGIATKIAKGSIEILNEVKLITAGNKVGSSEVALLAKLGIKPFTFGLKVKKIYDMGYVYEPAILDISSEDLLTKFLTGVNWLAAASLELGYPTAASVPHSIRGGFKKLAAIGIEIDYIFDEIKELKEAIDNPDAFAAAAPAAAAGAPAGGAAPAAAAPAAADDDDDDNESLGGGGGLFGDDDDDE